MRLTKKLQKSIVVSIRRNGYINRLAYVQTFCQKLSHAFERVRRYLQHTLSVERDEISTQRQSSQGIINFISCKTSPSIKDDNHGHFNTYTQA